MRLSPHSKMTAMLGLFSEYKVVSCSQTSVCSGNVFFSQASVFTLALIYLDLYFSRDNRSPCTCCFFQNNILMGVFLWFLCVCLSSTIHRSTQTLDLTLKGKYLVTVSATDPGGLSSSTVLDVSNVGFTLCCILQTGYKTCSTHQCFHSFYNCRFSQSMNPTKSNSGLQIIRLRLKKSSLRSGGNV